jgi:hypothetical protein
VQLPVVRRRASRAPDRDRARAAPRRPRVRLARGGVRRARGADRGARAADGRAGADRAGDRRRRHRPARPRGTAPRRAALAPARRDPGADGAAPTLPVYASGINPERPGDAAAALRAAGYTAFKLKVGFGAERDAANLAELRAAAGATAAVMVDANQAWDLDTAVAMAERPRLARAGVARGAAARRPASAEWQRLAAASPIPLAAGENAIGEAVFAELVASRAVAVVQPISPSGAGSRAWPRSSTASPRPGLRYCPHYLGGGIGLLASAHLLAARGDADGWLEVDANENPLRTRLCPPLATLANGRIALAEAPGLGLEPDLAGLRALLRLRTRARRAAASLEPERPVMACCLPCKRISTTRTAPWTRSTPTSPKTTAKTCAATARSSGSRRW